jgi:hypothetical protein
MRIGVALVFAMLAGSLVAAAEEPKKPAAGDGWTDLMKPDAWKRYDPKWVVADEVKLAPDLKGKADVRLKAEPKEGGKAWVNGETGRLPNLVTKEAFGDCEVHVEFLIAKNSNAGIKFQEVYEIQILDSFGKDKIDGTGMGGVYPRANLEKGGYLDRGIAPKVNAAKPPGEWNTLDVVWKSPRFDAKGEKIANAMIVKATLNGQVIHENQELKTPTGGNWMKKETANGSFMLQSDHGPTAWRDVRIKATK